MRIAGSKTAMGVPAEETHWRRRGEFSVLAEKQSGRTWNVPCTRLHFNDSE